MKPEKEPPFASRIFQAVPRHLADANARSSHPAEQFAWIWHPECAAGTTAVLRFRCHFHLSAAQSPVIHVTADQRFQLRCDGRDLSFGPDRSDVDHWTVQSLAVRLEAGDHTLEALVWWIADAEGGMRMDPQQGGIPTTALPPMAQMTWRGGLLIGTEDLPPTVLNSGTADWEVEDLTEAVRLFRPPIPTYHDVGPSHEFALEGWRPEKWVPARVVIPPLISNLHGVRRPGWSLHPASLPEQERNVWSGGRIRAVRASWGLEPFRPEEETGKDILPWQGLLKGEPLTIPPDTEVTVLWDFEQYYCGYPQLQVGASPASRVEWDWAESLYEEDAPEQVHGSSPKGHRGVIAAKVFLGFGDAWNLGPSGEMPFLWWRSGRYVRLRIRTGPDALVINRLGLLTTGYPLEKTGSWTSSDSEWDQVMPIFDASYRSAAHETWTDSPYYEQMSYLGDDRLHALANYAWYPDDRLSRKAIELFNWSRGASGLVAERYPSAWRQESVTYSMLWPLMVRDFLLWRDDSAFVRGLLPGLRSLLAELEGLKRQQDLIVEAPGWPFVDWVPGWAEGCGPGVREGDSSILNLHWVLCLQAAAEVEEAVGDPLLAQRGRDGARRIFEAILARFWSSNQRLLLDTSNHEGASEHAQFLALLTGLLDADRTRQCLNALKTRTDLSPASIYASFYLLEALYQHGEVDEFHRRLSFWRGLPALGFSCTPEAPEPSRSDSHAWGAHPAWHTLASHAGVRPMGPGFTSVRIAPLPGPLCFLQGIVVHPRGHIAVDLHFDADAVSGSVTLPENTPGEFVWQRQSRQLLPGKNPIS